ncbi:hypothetical protein HanHA300_Chr08g0269921 [Helianthus annuus]|nr:hypothetical protein HanHA300_Chr08g0269921 [Helianthus annuus]KAJ0552577.1 hypothetical protein HanHA89_Chr08g0286771 [Helianthus annuus]KAJ0718272.1 hypothetical protein HanLR1_Chr08g0268791 [Helianthus annuus]KAJ0721509.1 hypothetical protein HanOQP8_Chr08g0276331 [Helianthus annuus]
MDRNKLKHNTNKICEYENKTFLPTCSDSSLEALESALSASNQYLKHPKVLKLTTQSALSSLHLYPIFPL